MTAYDEMTAVLDTMNAEIIEENTLRAQYPYNVTHDEIKAMDKDARRALYGALVKILDYERGVKFDLAYAVYSDYEAILDAEYYAENIDRFNAWCKEHIWGKAWDDIDPETLDFYSDWHKDMYGYRPHRF